MKEKLCPYVFVSGDTRQTWEDGSGCSKVVLNLWVAILSEVGDVGQIAFHRGPMSDTLFMSYYVTTQ